MFIFHWAVQFTASSTRTFELLYSFGRLNVIEASLDSGLTEAQRRCASIDWTASAEEVSEFWVDALRNRLGSAFEESILACVPRLALAMKTHAAEVHEQVELFQLELRNKQEAEQLGLRHRDELRAVTAPIQAKHRKERKELRAAQQSMINAMRIRNVRRAVVRKRYGHYVAAAELAEAAIARMESAVAHGPKDIDFEANDSSSDVSACDVPACQEVA